MSRNWIIITKFFFLGAVSFGLSGLLSKDYQKILQNSSKESKADYSAGLLRVFSLGHVPTTVDWILVNSLANSSWQTATKLKHPHFFYDVEVATRLDPLFFDAYWVGVNILTVIQKDYDAALFLLSRSNEVYKTKVLAQSQRYINEFWTGSGLLGMFGGYIELTIHQNFEKAAKAFIESGNRPGAGAYFKSLGERLQSRSELYKYGLKFLNLLIAKEPDPDLKEGLEVRRDELYVKQYYEDLNDDFKKFIVEAGGRKSQDMAVSDNRDIILRELKKFFYKFMDIKHLSKKDPWGYILGIDQNGSINRN